MTTCEKCNLEAVSKYPYLCKTHFEEFILATVEETIAKYKLFTKEDKICVAISGGKDSLSLTDILLKLGYNLEGLFINEGISNYREFSTQDINTFANPKNLHVRVISFQDEFGFTLDQAKEALQIQACTICGTLRRYLLNKYAAEYKAILTGHNLDDAAQTTIINLARGNTDLFLRQGIKSKTHKLFTPRIKPLFFVKEEHLLLYSEILGVVINPTQCPNSPTSVRASIKYKLNDMEEAQPGTKNNIVQTYMDIKSQHDTEEMQVEINSCKRCQQASNDTICKSCKLIESIQQHLQQN